MAQSRLRVKKGDIVRVLAGKDKGKKGKVIEAMPSEGKLIVEGVNVAKRHTKPTQKIMQGGIIDKELPIHVSNVMLVCPRCSKPTKVGSRFLEDGRKVRTCKSCGEIIDK
ncbi:MAG: 50S ribosomal protein L24 [Bacillota bacterium]